MTGEPDAAVALTGLQRPSLAQHSPAFRPLLQGHGSSASTSGAYTRESWLSARWCASRTALSLASCAWDARLGVVSSEASRIPTGSSLEVRQRRKRAIEA
jgi:hypothetical protein